MSKVKGVLYFSRGFLAGFGLVALVLFLFPGLASGQVIGDGYDLGCGGYGVCSYDFGQLQPQPQQSFSFDFSQCYIISDTKYILVPSIPHYYQFMPVQVNERIVC